MKFELDDKQTNEIRNMIKDLYEVYGTIKGCKEMGNYVVNIDMVLEAYKSYIGFAELVLDERNERFCKRNDINKKENMKELMRNFKSKLD